MRIRVRHFARVRELTGTPAESLELPEGYSISRLLEKLLELHPPLNLIESSNGNIMLHRGYSVFVNGVHSDRDSELHDGDEVAIIPPISGG